MNRNREVARERSLAQLARDTHPGLSRPPVRDDALTILARVWREAMRRHAESMRADR